MKVDLLDKRIGKIFLQIVSAISMVISTLLLFIKIPNGWELEALFILILVFSLIYLSVWLWSNQLNYVKIDIEGTDVEIKVGDIFKEKGLKAIAFNEYFDTKVDDVIISKKSLNGIYISDHLNISVRQLDNNINKHQFEKEEVLEFNSKRHSGKKQKYKLGTIFIHDDYLLTAMTKFDSSNRASLTMPEYLEFLINFWDRVNKVYAQRSVTAPIFGSGITRIKGHSTISDEDLLKIMLWTFRISEMRFKYPAKLTIVIHKDKIDKINLLDMKLIKNGV